MKEALLTREQFREAVFKRDKNKCIFCPKPGVDAHHVLERRLFSGEQAGGYFLSNGALVCEEHHLDCESTVISVEDVRLAAGITKPVIPEHLYPDQVYDKWGNCILENGLRTKGELFFDESVQKILARGDKLHLFTDRVKYPRTMHFQWSPGMTSDDRVLYNTDAFEGRRVILTEKLDGENTTMYRDYIHARSIDGLHHDSRNWVKGFRSQFAHEIPEGWRICGENMYAEHSLHYYNLKSYFYMFSLWNERNVCQSWDDTIEWGQILGIETVPVLYDGIFDEAKIRKICESLDREKVEGAVLRVADAFAYGDFKNVVAKYVRKNHVTTGTHWMYGKMMRPNHLDGTYKMVHMDEDEPPEGWTPDMMNQ